jgi:DNA-directed RNA polymerase specialized sigma24 family protein
LNGQNDQKRFARIVLPHLADAYALVRWLTGNGIDAEDVVQNPNSAPLPVKSLILRAEP